MLFFRITGLLQLADSMPSRQERVAGGAHKQDQICCWQDPLAPICAPRHHLKLHRGVVEENWKNSLPGDSAADKMSPELPRWSSLNASMNMA